MFDRLCLAVIFCLSLSAPLASCREFTIANDRFIKDGEVLQIISGSVHYHRIHPAYWEDRLQRVKALGFNTIELYVAWNIHEPYPNTYVWVGIADLERYLKLIQKLGMNVLLRPGPYICAEWDFGGFPWWLASPAVSGGGTMQLRQKDEQYLFHVDRWFRKMLPVVAPYMYHRGGPILMVQIENEYGFVGGDLDYIRHLVNLAQGLLGKETILYTTDPPPSVQKGSLPGDEVFTVVDFGPGWYDLDQAFGAQKSMNLPGKSPALCAEFYPGWLVHWGEKMANTSAEVLTDYTTRILQYNNGSGSVSFYMLHGGTNFGFTAGANVNGDTFLPDLSSYDYDTLISEAGATGQPGTDGPNKYMMIREAVEKHTGVEPPEMLPEPVGRAYGKVQFGSEAPLIATLPYLPGVGDGIPTKYPEPMEHYDIGHGLIIYRTTLGAGQMSANSELNFGKPPHDIATVLANGNKVGTLSRNLGPAVTLDFVPPANGEVVLDVIVEELGRDNGGTAWDLKGLMSGNITLDGMPLNDWRVFPYKVRGLPEQNINPFDLFQSQDGLVKQLLQNPDFAVDRSNARPSLHGPAIYVGFLEIDIDSNELQPNGHLPDTWLDNRGWGRGMAMVNGFNLGYYWPTVGPQMTQYVPGPVLRNGTNILLIIEFDHAPSDVTAVFTDTPNFYGPQKPADASESLGFVRRSGAAAKWSKAHQMQPQEVFTAAAGKDRVAIQQS